MIFSGLQKLTLLDFPGRVACTVFTGGCNLRCPFCHNAGLVLPGRERDEIGEEELFAFLRKRQGILDGVAVTGGEPLLHGELSDFLKRVKELGFLIKLDTNGTSPDKLERLVRDGLVDRVAMDVKSSKAGYALCCGVPGLDTAPIEESVRFLLECAEDCGVEYEFRTTAVKGLHTRADFAAIGRWIAGAKEYYIQGFRDSGDLIDATCLSAFTERELAGLLDEVRPNVPNAALRG